MQSRLQNRANPTERPSAGKILIADDALSSRELLRVILERSGYEVVEAANGLEVVDKVAEFIPDLVILDLQMPKLDGYSAAVSLRKIPGFPGVPIVALAAALPEVSPERMRDAGFTEFLVKPISPSRLRNCVAQLLSTHR